jgi:hypothetical protein
MSLLAAGYIIYSLDSICSTIRLAADPSCSANLQQAVLAIDAVLTSGNGWLKKTLKGLFGVADLSHDEDFASLITVSPPYGSTLT